MSKAKKKKSGGDLFWKVFAVVLVVFCLACVGILYFGDNVIHDYENSASYAADIADSYAEKIQNGDYSFIDETGVKFTSYEFEGTAIEDKLTDIITEAGGCTAEKGFSENRTEKPVYVIMAGKTKIATLEFAKRAEKSEYGFNQYELKSVEFHIKGSYEISLLAPEASLVYINDKLVPDSYKTGETEVVSLSKYDISATSGEGGSETYCYYTISGLMNEPTAKIVYSDGTEALMKYDDTKKVFTTKTEGITVTAPKNMKVLVDGVEISADSRFVSKDDVAIERIQTAMEYVEGEYTMREYTVEGIRRIDSIAVTGTTFNGEDAFPTVDETGTEYVFDDCIWPSDITSFGVTEEWLIERVLGYARFVMHDNYNHDTKKGEDKDELILKYCYRGAQVYEDFDNFWVTMAIHDYFWIENESVDMVQFFGENLFSAKVSFDYWIEGYDHKHGNRKMYDTVATFYYGKIDGNWKIVDWELG